MQVIALSQTGSALVAIAIVLVMFTLLIFFGLIAQISGDILRLRRYREE